MLPTSRGYQDQNAQQSFIITKEGSADLWYKRMEHIPMTVLMTNTDFKNCNSFFTS